MADSTRFFQVESDLRSSARNRQILLIPAYKEATSNVWHRHHLYTLVPQLLRYELAECFRTPSSFATSLNTCQMSSCPLIPLKVFLRWNRHLCATTSHKVSPCSKHTDSMLPWSFSSYTQSQTFHLITKKLAIQIWQIARSRHRNLKKLCQIVKGDFKFWRALSSWSEAFWRASRKLLSKDKFSPFDSWGVPPSSLLESLSVLTLHKSWAGACHRCPILLKHAHWLSASATRRLPIEEIPILMGS